jgi:dolichol-phosphate mannosyltransferase
MTAGPRISVILPVYLNRPHLPDLYRRLTAVMPSLTNRYELVFVDDAGGDGALEWLRACHAKDDRVVVVELAHNVGQHAAVMAGLTQSSGEVVGVMDADLQDPPEDLPRLVYALGSEDAVVFARRVLRHQSWGRHLTGRLFKRLLRRLAGSRVPAGTGMFFVTSRGVIDKARALPIPARYVPLLLAQTGVPMRAIDVTKQLRTDRRSAYSARRRVELAMAAIRQALEWRRTTKRR